MQSFLIDPLSAATMADLFCSFLDIRSISTNYYQLRLFSPSKNLSNSLVYSYNSRIMNRKALHLTFLSQSSSPEFDVVSTHEHSDGSLIFRFGDPSEVVENVKVEEQNEIIEIDSKEEFHVPEVLDGDLEREVVNESHSDVQSGQSIIVVDKEMLSGEKLLEGLVEIEKLSFANVAVLDKASEVEDSVAIVDESLQKKSADMVTLQSVSLEIDNEVSGSGSEILVTKDVFLNFEDKNVEDEIKSKNIEGSEEDCSNESLPSSQLQLDRGSLREVESENLEVSLGSESEGGTDDVVVLDDIINDGRKSDVIELTSQSCQSEAESELDEVKTGDKVAEEIQEDINDLIIMSSLSPQLQPPFSLANEDPCITNVSTNSENQAVKAKIENDLKESILASTQWQPDGSLLKEANSDNLGDPAVSVSEGYITMQDEMVEGGSESVTIESTSASFQLEPEVKLDEAETNKIVEDFLVDEIDAKIRTESILIEITSVPPKLETESVTDEEMGNETVDDFQDGDGTESPIMINVISRDMIAKTERITEDDNVQINELLEASGNEVTELESTEFTSKEMLMADFVLSSGAALLPHPSKALTGGEDAYFVTGDTWLGVADGVSHWSLEGTKPGVYAQELIRNCDKLVTDHIITRPLELLHLSVTETHSIGSSTVLIAQVDGQALNVANIGDSGFIILRHGTVYRRSSPMLHLFHFPLQIERGADLSHLAEFYQVDLEEDDVIITATDGLLDNLYALEISSTVLKLLAANTNLKEIAEALARRAQEVGKSPSSRSPFADTAQAAGYVGYAGGKLDDVAVIVSVVKRRSN